MKPVVRDPREKREPKREERTETKRGERREMAKRRPAVKARKPK